MVCEDLSRIVYCRYGLGYLRRGFSDGETNGDGPLDVGSYAIDLDHLIYQKQK